MFAPLAPELREETAIHIAKSWCAYVLRYERIREKPPNLEDYIHGLVQEVLEERFPPGELRYPYTAFKDTARRVRVHVRRIRTSDMHSRDLRRRIKQLEKEAKRHAVEEVEQYVEYRLRGCTVARAKQNIQAAATKRRK